MAFTKKEAFSDKNEVKTAKSDIFALEVQIGENVVVPTENQTVSAESSDNRTELHVGIGEQSSTLPTLSDKSPVSFQVRNGRLRTVVDPRLNVTEVDMRAAFAAMTPDVVNTLGQLLTHFDARIRLAACMQILDRAWGKPTTKVNVSTAPTRNHVDTSKWTPEERAQARMLLEKSLNTATIATQELQGDIVADLPTELEVGNGRTKR